MVIYVYVHCYDSTINICLRMYVNEARDYITKWILYLCLCSISVIVIRYGSRFVFTFRCVFDCQPLGWRSQEASSQCTGPSWWVFGQQSFKIGTYAFRCWRVRFDFCNNLLYKSVSMLTRVWYSCRNNQQLWCGHTKNYSSVKRHNWCESYNE